MSPDQLQRLRQQAEATERRSQHLPTGRLSREDRSGDPALVVAPDVAQRLRSAVAEASSFYHQQFHQSDEIRAELFNRIGTAAVIPEPIYPAIGYAPPGWTQLLDHMRGQGFSDGTLLDAGLVKYASTGRLIDVMRDRITLAVTDTANNPVGFTGRTRSADPEVPKYLNTPATDIFDKGKLLLGIGTQLDRISNATPIVLVEGALDALALQANPDPARPVAAVATMGTACTGRHVALLDEHAPAGTPITLAFDPDPAGQIAATNAAEMMLPLDRPVRIAKLPTGTDPAELATRERHHVARHLDPSRTQDAATALIEHRVAIGLGDHPDEVPSQVAAMRGAVGVIAKLPFREQVDRGIALAGRLNLDPGTVASEIGRARTAGRDALGRLAGRYTVTRLPPHTDPAPAREITAALAQQAASARPAEPRPGLSGPNTARPDRGR